MIVLFIFHECCYCVNLINTWCVVVEVIIFSSVRFLSKTSNQNRFLKQKTKTVSNRSVSVWFGLVWFGYFGEKTGSNRLGSFFPGLARFYSSLVWFGFFCFRLINPKPNRTDWFFFTVRFFQLLFFQFSRFNQFFSFFAHPYIVVLDCD